MNRIESLFLRKKEHILNIYCTAGFPHLDDTVPVMKALQENGADIIELGMPYSDPVADGPVIQHSNMVALHNGMTIEKLFRQLQGFRQEVFAPVILMGYMNPVMQYGFERFCQHAAAAAIDGLIIPDLPMYEFETEYGPLIRKYGLSFIFMVTPETSVERVKKIDELSTGFVYAVSSSSTTGKNADLSSQQAYFKRLKDLNLRNPILIGFGISDRKSFESACEHANGAIIGSAFIRSLEESKNLEQSVKTFLNGIVQG